MKHDQMESASILGSQSGLQTPMDDEYDPTIIRWPCCDFCRNNAVGQLAGNGTQCTQSGDRCSPKQVKDFVSSVTEKCSTLKEIEITNVVIFLSKLDRIFYKKLSFLTNYVNPVTLPNLEALKLSISTPKNKRYKKIFKLLLFFIQGKSRLNRLWEVSTRLQTVDLKCGNETIIKFDKTTKELVVGGICKFLHEFEKLQTLIFDSANCDFTLDIESLLKATQLKVLVIGHCKVIFTQGYNAMKNQLNGKHVTFFNCSIEDKDLQILQNGDEEISIDETGNVSKPVKTQWSLKEILQNSTKYSTLKNDQHYFELFRMDNFSTYEYRYFRITSSEEPPRSSSLNPTFSADTVSQANTPSTITNANTVRQEIPLQMIANENDLVLQQHTSTLSTVQEILQLNPAISPTLTYTVSQTENFSIRQHPAKPTTSLILETPLSPSTSQYTPSTELGKLLATKLKNVVNDLDRR
ncbi:unnamed protein product, partial [Allacma fusca]